MPCTKGVKNFENIEYVARILTLAAEVDWCAFPILWISELIAFALYLHIKSLDSMEALCTDAPDDSG